MFDAITAPKLTLRDHAISCACEIAAFDASGTASIGAALGLPMPGPGKSVELDGAAFLNIGPERWLVLAAGPDAAASMQVLPALDAAAFIDQSHGYVAFTLSGEAARQVLAKGTAIDLHPTIFRPGSVAVTAFAQMRAILWLRDTTPAFEIVVSRSYARSFHEWLVEACGAFLNS